MPLSPSLRSVASRSERTKDSRRRRRQGAPPQARRRLVLERLEDRTLPSAYIVTTTADSGPGSLRDAITQVNTDTSHTLYTSPSDSSKDEIDFAIGGGGLQTIAPVSALPVITNAVILDGTTQPGFASHPLIELNGMLTGAGTDGLDISAGGTTIRGLAINRFSGNGLTLTGGGGDLVVGDYIGTDPAGLTALGNAGSGVFIENSAGNTVGGTSVGARNVISGNSGCGVYIHGPGSTANVIQGSYIGTDRGGTLGLGNTLDGIRINNASGNTVGGTAAGAGNLLSGNVNNGIGIFNSGDSNLVQGNLIGTSAYGLGPLGNSVNGVFISSGNYNTIGGTTAAARNVISGTNLVGSGFDQGNGVSLDYGTGNVVAGNYIGTDKNGTFALGNANSGIGLTANATGDTIGGAVPGAGNVIAGNGIFGISAINTTGIQVQGNRIGTNAAGNAALDNGRIGILALQSSNWTIGGVSSWSGGVLSGAGNLISGQPSYGIQVAQNSSGFVIQGNAVGPDLTGSIAIGNGGGVTVDMTGGTIGGTSVGLGNVVSGNPGRGIEIDSNSSNVAVLGNFVGMTPTGSGALPNQGDGVADAGTGDVIGGTLAGAGNVIAFNTGAGVRITGLNDRIQGNSIHDNLSLGIDLGNDGVTPNGPQPRTGANNLVNFPVLTGAVAGSSTWVRGTYVGLANTTYTLDFYASPTADPSGHGQGARYLGSLPVTTDQNGNGSFSSATFQGCLLGPSQVGEVISATATDAAGDTSEFSQDLRATGSGPLMVNTTLNDGALGWNSATMLSLRDAINLVNCDTAGNQFVGSHGADEIDFQIPWNDPGHVYYQATMGNVQPVPAGTSSDADLTGTAAPQWQHSWWKITLQSSLPSIAVPVFINGYSQSGSSWNALANDDNAVLRIELNGGGPGAPGNGDGLTLAGGNSAVRGLVINGLGYHYGIVLNDTGNDLVQGNFIGTDVSGLIAPYGLPNFSTGAGSDLHEGVHLIEPVSFQHDYIGTDSRPDAIDPPGWTDVAERNIISAAFAGVVFYGQRNTDPTQYGAAQTNNVVAGNFIGTDVHGTTALGNFIGVTWLAGAHDDLVGTDGNGVNDAGERNVISGNLVGVSPGGGTALASYRGAVAGNYIGVGADGSPLGNLIGGVVESIGSLSDRIGGPSATLGNTIAYNGISSASLHYDLASNGQVSANAPGVWIFTRRSIPQDATVQGNSIHDNAGLGIDLGGAYPSPGPDGVTPNDSQGHSGPNNWQNFPVLTSASSSSTSTYISGTFSEGAEPNTTLTLDFYANATGSSTTYGQGQTYLGSRTVVTDGTGNVSFSADMAVGNLAGQWISATATDEANPTLGTLGGNTSEFSLDIQATSAPGQTFAQNLSSSLPQSATGNNTMIVQANPSTIGDVLNGLAGLGPVTAVNFYLNLDPGKYSGQTVSVPSGMTLYINGSKSSQLPTNFDPAVPAFTLVSGNAVVSNVTFTETGDAPTILVTGGSLTLRNDIVQESTNFTDAAIAVTGGTLDLGTATSPGNNIINVNGTGQFVQNTTANSMSAVGDTFTINGGSLSAPLLSFTSLTASVNPSTLNQSVTLTASVRANGSSATPTRSVDFFDATTNTDLGSVSLSGGSASLSTSALAAGNHVIRASYSGDATFLPSLGSLLQSVQYKFSGFLAPLNTTAALALNRTVPIKFKLTDYNGNYITSLSAVTSLQVLNSQGQNVLTNAGSTALRYDSTANQFIANWNTKGLAAGSYTISLTLADGTTETITVQLTKSGNSAGLTTVAAGGTGSAPGGLLGGNIELYVDNTNGDLTADELARIQDAVTAVDAVTEPYGVAVQEVTDPTLADVTLNMDTSSAVGGYADGVLGCTTDAGQITLIQGWNLYAGSDATQIGSGQFDFETVVTHELGHALGLGHSTDSTSVMYATLNAGTVNRGLTTADLNVPDTDSSGACGLHAAAVAPTVLPSGAGLQAGLAGNPGIAVASPTSELSRNLFFALLGSAELPLGSRQLPGRSGEPSRTGDIIARDAAFADGMAGDQTFALPGSNLSAKTSSPIFAGQLQREKDDPLFDVPLFLDPSLDGQGDGSRPDETATEAAGQFADFIAADPNWLDD